MKDVWYLHDIDMFTTDVKEAIKYKHITNLTEKINNLQYKIDTLMLEHCPEEMSKQQLQNWAENQKYQTSHLEGNNMKEWKELSENAAEQMAFIGAFSPTTLPEQGLIKGYMAEYGSLTRTYLDASDLRKLAEACIEVAEWLEARKSNFKQNKE